MDNTINFIEDGKQYLLKNFRGYDHKLVISEIIPADSSYIDMYLFGDEFMMGTQHDFETPKDLLIHYLDRYVRDIDMLDIGKHKDFPQIKYDSEIEKHKTTLKLGNTEKYFWGESRLAIIKIILPHLANMLLIEFLRIYTDYDVVSIYCVNDDPDDLTVSDTDLTAEQIGYAIVNTTGMYKDTFYESPLTAVENMLDEFCSDELYTYKLYVKEEDGSWDLIEEGTEYEGCDVFSNGMLDALGYEWIEAEEMEAAEVEINESVKDEDTTTEEAVK